MMPSGVVDAYATGDPNVGIETQSYALIRVIRRALLLLCGVGAAWIISALLNTPGAQAATMPTPAGLPAIPAVGAPSTLGALTQPATALSPTVTNVVNVATATVYPAVSTTTSSANSALSSKVLTPATTAVSPATTALSAPLGDVTQTVATPVATVLAGVTSIVDADALAPVQTALAPVQTILAGTQLGGVLTSPPAPIRLGSPAASTVTGLQPVAPVEAETPDATASGATVLATHAATSRPAGSVPISTLLPGRLPVPGQPASPLAGLPTAPADSGSGAGTGGSAGLSNIATAGTTRTGSGLSIRLPIDDRSAVARLVADDPSFAPD